MGEQPVIEYGMKTGWTLPRWVVRLFVVLAACVLIWIGGAFVPTRKLSITRGCSICGIGEEEESFSVAGLTLRHTVRRTQMHNEQRYEALVGVPHVHDWQRRGVTGLHGSLWGYHGVGEGGPDWRGNVARESLDFMEAGFATLPKEERQTIYARLIATKDREDFNQVLGALLEQVASERRRAAPGDRK
jgi:hypothetical protein